MSIRLRLTLLYTAILAIALVVSSVALYASQSQTTLDIVKTNLTRQGELFAHGPRSGPGDSNEPLPGANLPGRWTQMRSADGTVVARSNDISDITLPLSAEGLAAVQSGGRWFETAQVSDEPLLIYSVPARTQAGQAAIVQVAAPIGEREQALNNLKLILVLGCGMVILMAFGLSWVVGGTALSPIQRITHTARAIGAEQDLSRRVRHSGPNDEVGQLAATFNTMLDALEAAHTQLEQALDSQRRFVADASHELRTPLTTVRGNIELLEHKPPLSADERAEVLADTQDEVERLIRLVNQLLALARADAGHALRREPIPLGPLLEDVCRQTKLLGPGRTLLCEPATGLTALGDRDALKQVCLILLDNAVVHTPPEAQVAVTAARVGARVEIRFHDTGAGMEAETLAHIFERFYRGDSSRSGRSSGLGLAIARDLVQAQGGDLTVQSAPGQGSTFRVALPAA